MIAQGEQKANMHLVRPSQASRWVLQSRNKSMRERSEKLTEKTDEINRWALGGNFLRIQAGWIGGRVSARSGRPSRAGCLCRLPSFQLRYALLQSLHLQVYGAYGCRVGSQARVNGTGPLVELGEQLGFQVFELLRHPPPVVLKLLANPAPVVVCEWHCLALPKFAEHSIPYSPSSIFPPWAA